MSRYPQRRNPKTGKTYYCHRAVAEWHLGRPLEPGEVVHHRDENRKDRHPGNLAVLLSQRVRMLLHWYQKCEAKGVQHLWLLEVIGECWVAEPNGSKPHAAEVCQAAEIASLTDALVGSFLGTHDSVKLFEFK